MTRDVNLYLLQIQEAVNRIRRYTEGGDLERVWAVIEKDLSEVSDQLLALTGPHTSPADE